MTDDPSQPPAPLRDGRYVLVAPLGAGTQGTTWDAVDKREGRPVAIKRFDVRGARAWKDVELAEREARVLSDLSHPKLPRYMEHFEEGGALYLVMEKIEGTPLSVLRARGALSEQEVVDFLRDAADVLSYLHGRAPPVVHRDIKPSNVIRRPDGTFAFVDFGAVRDRMRPAGGSTVVGTFGYMAPEQFQGRASPSSDVYAVGATALALLTGTEPEDLPHRGLGIDVNAALGGHVGPKLREALERMLEPNPDERARSIAELFARPQGASSSRGRRSREPFFDPSFARPPFVRAPFASSFGEEARDFASELGRVMHGRVHEEIADNVSRALGSDGFRSAMRQRREMERARKRARREQRHRNRRRFGRLPWFVVGILLLGLGMAYLAVNVALRAVVPLVLVSLSLFFGAKLRAAARAVLEAGGRASESIDHARQQVLDPGRPWPEAPGASVGAPAARRPSETFRVEDDPRIRVRESSPDDEFPGDDHEEAHRTGPRGTYRL